MSRLLQLGMLNRAGMQSFNAGRLDDALFQLFQADRIARCMTSPLHEAKVRNNIGLVQQASGRVEEAAACFRVAREAAVRGAGYDTGLYRTISRNLSLAETAVEGKVA